MLAAWCPEGKLRGVSAASLHPREVDLSAVATEAKNKVNKLEITGYYIYGKRYS